MKNLNDFYSSIGGIYTLLGINVWKPNDFYSSIGGIYTLLGINVWKPNDFYSSIGGIYTLLGLMLGVFAIIHGKTCQKKWKKGGGGVGEGDHL
jgi:hypothetical protein